MYFRRRADVQLVSILISGDKEAFTLMVEPEGMSYEFPNEGKVLLTFRGTGAAKVELRYDPGCITVWRPRDTEVWAATATDHDPKQIGGWGQGPGFLSAAKQDQTFYLTSLSAAGIFAGEPVHRFTDQIGVA
jgi:hypothetical protein